LFKGRATAKEKLHEKPFKVCEKAIWLKGKLGKKNFCVSVCWWWKGQVDEWRFASKHGTDEEAWRHRVTGSCQNMKLIKFIQQRKSWKKKSENRNHSARKRIHQQQQQLDAMGLMIHE